MFARALLLVLAVAVTTQDACAQVIAVFIKEGKPPKGLKGHLVQLPGGLAVIGEPKDGIRFDPERRILNYRGNGNNELFVADPGKPGEVPYEIEKGERVERSKKHVVTINGADIERLGILMADETLAGLAREYELRADQLERLREERDALDKTTVAWGAWHVRLVSAMERLERWLNQTGFAEAATDLAKERTKLEKRARDDALHARADEALASVKKVDPPEDLVALAAKISGGKDVFLGVESKHLRIWFIDELGEREVFEVIKFGEEVIEGFRAEFVDPYLAEDYPDTIPEGHFVEWLYVPDSDAKYEQYTHEYWNVSWERDREVRLAMGGGRMNGGPRRPYRFYRKNRDLDLDAIICHDLGHALSGVHYGGERLAIAQDWMSEGAAYYLSFEFLARNSVTCKAFDAERAGYVERQAKREAGEKTVGVARRDLYNEVALKAGRPIDQLALRDLVVMDDADLAKSWSFFDYIAREEGEAGQRWLRSAGRHAWNEQEFIARWRADAAEILGVDPGLAFKDIEERWKEYAIRHQETGEKTRRRR